MDRQTLKKFQIIFQEAHVVDLDFSMWDRYIRIVAVASLMPPVFADFFPIFNIDFQGVSNIEWISNHLDIELDYDYQHCQWTIYESDIRKDGTFYKIELEGVEPAPKFSIGCKTVNIENVSPDIIDSVNPDWNNPYRPFARLSFDEINTRLKICRKKHV